MDSMVSTVVCEAVQDRALLLHEDRSRQESTGTDTIWQSSRVGKTVARRGVVNRNHNIETQIELINRNREDGKKYPILRQDSTVTFMLQIAIQSSPISFLSV